MTTPKSNRKYVIDSEIAMSKWDYEKNNEGGLDPAKLTIGSHIHANFICPNCGHKWKGEIRNAIRYNGCQDCMKKARATSNIKSKLKKGQSLFESNPELEKEWDYEKNKEIGLDPKYVMAGTPKKAYWICPLGHHYIAYISNRARKHTGCTFCSGQSILKGFNDLATTRPDLLNQWDYEKNNKLGIFPEEVMQGTHKVVNWICPVGHEYVKEIKTRCDGQGCTICAKESQTSFPEQAIYFYMLKIFNKVENRYGNPEIDVYIPKLKFGIEYDGLFAHKNKEEKEKQKNEIITSRGIYLIRIKEVKNLEKEDTDNTIYCTADNNYIYLERVLEKILFILKSKYNIETNLKIDIEADRISIEEQYIKSLKKNSILTVKPELEKEWDYSKNGKIKPEYVSYGSSKLYWWICKNGHSYKYAPKKKEIDKGCPICANKKLLSGFNDLKSKYPELLKSWDFDLNKIEPQNILFNTKEKFYWKCDRGHSYRSSIATKLKGTKCSICTGKELVKGVNGLATIKPYLIKEWDFAKNKYSPYEVTANSNKLAYWICSKCGYHWKSSIANRINCPECAKKSNIINVYDVTTKKLLYTFNNIRDLCNKLDINYSKQHGNISSVCNRKQKTLMNKYILRYDNDDEFKKI